MTRFIVAVLLSATVTAGVAHAQPAPECRNLIGIYTEEAPTPATAQALANYNGAPGLITAHVVITDPWNDGLDRPVTTLGGFEFRILVPDGAAIVAAVLPPASFNFHSVPDNWLVGTNLPVVDGAATLLTLTIMEGSGTPGFFHLAPVISRVSIPGNICIADFDDGFGLTAARPGSGSFAAPVFGLYTGDEVRTGPCGVTTWHVATDGDDAGTGSSLDPFLTIARGIAAAATGDTVLLHAGTYPGDGNRDLDFGGKGIVLRGATGDPADVVLDCGSTPTEAHIGIHLHSGEPAGTRLEAFTIINASIGSGPPWSGAIYVEGTPGAFETAGDGAQVHIQDCVVSGVTGSGVAVVGGGNRVTIDGSTFRGCTRTGGRLYENEWSHAPVTNCVFADNGWGASTYEDFAWRFEDCLFRGNGYGASSLGLRLDGAEFVRCTFDSNGTGFYGPVGDFQDCVVRDNTGDGFQFFEDGANRIEGTRVFGNDGYGLVIAAARKSAPPAAAGSKADKGVGVTVAGSSFLDNDLGGLSLHLDLSSVTLEGTVVADNGGPGVRVTTAPTWQGDLDVTSCTIAGNQEGILVATTQAISLACTRTIIAGNALCGLTALPGQVAGLAQNLFFANLGGDLATGLTVVPADGNLFRDPYFCDPEAGAYGLMANSPCAPSLLHDLIGALDVACAGLDAPVLLAVQDVPADQGGQVRLTWYRSGLDEAGSPTPIVGYDVYRRIDGAAGAAPAPGGGKLLGWDYLLRVPARGDQGYETVVATLCDSTLAGACASTFLVSAATADPLVFFDSELVSGCSVDNLAPGVPATVTAAYRFDSVTLDWDDAPEADFRYYRVYRSSEPDFDPQPADLVHETELSTWVDPLPEPWGNHYKVTAVDFAGNEGEPGAPAAGDVSAVGDGPSPARTALLGAAPNPFNPVTTLAFNLSAAAPVRLRVFDAAGRLVVTLLDARREAGRHAVVWNGRDAGGRAVGSGIYLCRLEAGAYRETKRMTLVR